MAASDDETGRQWEIAVVGLSGSLCGSMLVGGDEIHDLQKRLATSFGISTSEQRIIVGAKKCRPKEKLADCLDAVNTTTVTLIRLNPAERSCKNCGARGLFGRTAKLRRCAGCLDNFYCDNQVCQITDWPRHKPECFKHVRWRTADVPPHELRTGICCTKADAMMLTEDSLAQRRGTPHGHLLHWTNDGK